MYVNACVCIIMDVQAELRALVARVRAHLQHVQKHVHIRTYIHT